MKIKDYPTEIQILVFREQIRAGNRPNKDICLVYQMEHGNFNWSDSINGEGFWNDIDNGEYHRFYSAYPNIGLPEYGWYVKGDPIVTKYLNETYNDGKSKYSEGEPLANYYGFSGYYNKDWSSNSVDSFGPNAIELTLKEFQQLTGTGDATKEIIGYKFKSYNYHKAANILFGVDYSDLPKATADGVHFYPRSPLAEFLKKEDLLSKWTTTIYKEDKNTVVSVQGGFEIEVSTKGLYNKTTKKWLDIEDVRTIANDWQKVVDIYDEITL